MRFRLHLQTAVTSCMLYNKAVHTRVYAENLYHISVKKEQMAMRGKGVWTQATTYLFWLLPRPMQTTHYGLDKSAKAWMLQCNGAKRLGL